MKNLQVYQSIVALSCVSGLVTLEYHECEVGEIMRALINSCRNMQVLLFGLLAAGGSRVVAFYWNIARGKKTILTASLGLIGLYLITNWLIIGVCELLWLFNIDVTLKKSTFFMLLAPFFVFACYCTWQAANTLDNKLLKLVIKAATIGYLYITVGSFVVSSGVLKWTGAMEEMNAVVYPLKVEKSTSTAPLERFENTFY